VRKKVSGPLHKDTTYGDTGEDVVRNRVTYRRVVTRKPLASLTPKELDKIRDGSVRATVKDWVEQHGGDPKTAFAKHPVLSPNGPEIRKARIIVEQQAILMAPASTGYASLGSNHHLAIYRLPDGKLDWRIVSMFEASRRLARREPVVAKNLPEGGSLAMSIALGDTIGIEQGERTGHWVANILSANGQIFFRRVEDALPTGETKWGPNANTLFKEGARKLSIDPIGRVRPAND
jgi:CRISPR-associated endonuclease Csn1